MDIYNSYGKLLSHAVRLSAISAAWVLNDCEDQELPIGSSWTVIHIVLQCSTYVTFCWQGEGVRGLQQLVLLLFETFYGGKLSTIWLKLSMVEDFL